MDPHVAMAQPQRPNRCGLWPTRTSDPDTPLDAKPLPQARNFPSADQIPKAKRSDVHPYSYRRLLQ